MIDDNFGDFGDSMDDDDDDDDEQERATLLSIISRNQETSKASAMAVNEKFSKFWTALLLAQPPKPLGNVQPPPSKILYLKDIDDIVQTPLGSIVLPTLISTTINLRRAGQNVMVIAGLSPSLISSKNKYDDEVADDEVAKRATSVGDIGASGPIPLNVILQKLRSDNPNDLPNGLPALTYDTFPGPTQCLHHISIPPYIPPTYPPGPVNYTQLLQSNQGNTEQFKRDKADRIKEINSRNLLTVLRFRGGFLDDSDSSESVLQALPGISSQVWGFLKVYRIISNAIGARCLSDIKKNDTMPTKVLLTLKDLSHGLTISNETAKLRQSTQSRIIKGKAVPIKPSFRVEECDRYERRLLGSIVDPSQIKTTFKTTIIPPETIQTLQTMITLPLVRPQLFSYGLLQDEFLSGLLLFGPPGTGKTLLAKAVARESGARMLEIKASNIFDMFVGEGEKNVSAVFSLARKLSPCVIFLDEVDSIFCSRSRGGAGVGGNSSQREILNQFMVEWDGLRSSGQNHGIILMASTNRPFELDDAVLRRLPRRIMVDLPSEEAREQILKVYLSKEQLDGDIDIKELAKKTEFYSGSDLKNLCVSATLTCVREDVENEIMATNARKEPSSTVDDSAVEGARPVDKVIDLSLLLDQNKETLSSEPTLTSTVARILRKRHFEKALTQITPSCSENMSSLTELRKWDGLYGDGGNRRRKVLRGIGFEAGSPSPSHGDRRQDTSTSLKRL
ncbi:P-loop containing nucleoside triphosphate hydrolase protein [Mortierella sp. GBAus27b]|nr:P-loop containing nucleoside triphosphate hydrolase protein [Mortierella sp. GBAus27b]